MSGGQGERDQLPGHCGPPGAEGPAGGGVGWHDARGKRHRQRIEVEGVRVEGEAAGAAGFDVDRDTVVPAAARYIAQLKRILAPTAGGAGTRRHDGGPKGEREAIADLQEPRGRVEVRGVEPPSRGRIAAQGLAPRGLQRLQFAEEGKGFRPVARIQFFGCAEPEERVVEGGVGGRRAPARRRASGRGG